jgi:hypothetical protein
VGDETDVSRGEVIPGEDHLMDASNRMLLAILLFVVALGLIGLLFAYPAFTKFIPRRVALAMRLACLISAAGAVANGVYALRGGLSTIGLMATMLPLLIMVFVLRPWNERYYRAERARENAQLRRLGPHLIGLDGDQSAKGSGGGASA